MSKKETEKQDIRMQMTLYQMGKVLALLFAVFIILWKTGMLDPLLRIDGKCLFYKVTGVFCPGCGATRAFFALLSFHPLKSLYYHPAFFYFVICYVAIMSNCFLYLHFKGSLMSEKSTKILLYTGVALLMLQWFVKLGFPFLFHKPYF